MSATDALTNALLLALLAPDQARSARATALAESIAQSCTAKQVASAICLSGPVKNEIVAMGRNASTPITIPSSNNVELDIL